MRILGWTLVYCLVDFRLADPNVGVRILAGCTTGAMAVSVAQPTDVVKVRFQAQMNLQGVGRRYNGTMQAYRQIFQLEGLRGLWKGAAQKELLILNMMKCTSFSQGLLCMAASNRI